MKILLIYLALVNLAGYLAMGADKKRARTGRRRIRERTLLLTAGLGGAAGVILGMIEFRHKTLHRAFTLGVPVMAIAQAAALVAAVLLFKT